MISAGPTRQISAVSFILMDVLLFPALPQEEEEQQEEDGSTASAPLGWAPSREQDTIQPGCHQVSLHPWAGALLFCLCCQSLGGFIALSPGIIAGRVRKQ